MRILAIDPSSERHATSTTGVVLMDNATIVDYWMVPYGSQNFIDWYNTTGKHIKRDITICEKFEVRHGDTGRDNSVVHVMNTVTSTIPEVELIRNVGYGTDVPDALMKKLDLWKFDVKTHHNDIRAAARLALFYAMRTDIQEVVDAIGDKLYANQ